MPTLTNITWSPKAAEVDHQWFVVDANGHTLGRLATEVARVLRGKHKPTFAEHMDMGDYVIVVNAEKIAVTGKKLTQKIYYRHSGYPGGFKKPNYTDVERKFPGRIIEICREGDAAEEPPRQAAIHEAEGLCRRGAPACRAEAGADGDQ